MPPLSIKAEYSLQKRRQEKIERDFVFKIIPKSPADHTVPSVRSFNIPYTNYEKYVLWLID